MVLARPLPLLRLVRRTVDLWAWVPPAGHVITYNTPQEVVIMEKDGSCGANEWGGLVDVMDDINSNFWQGQNAIWVSHQCSLCTQNIDMQGGPILVQAAVCDGNANVGYRRCAVKNCPLDIANNNRDR